jgi:hypothetical protein
MRTLRTPLAQAADIPNARRQVCGMRPPAYYLVREKPCKRLIGNWCPGEGLLGMTGGQACGNLRRRAGFAGISRSRGMQFGNELAHWDNKKVLICR